MDGAAVLERWNDASVESMYDKTLLGLETRNILEWIPKGSTICDVGCGEGEATLEYAKVGKVTAVDNSPTRLKLARERLGDSVEYRECSVFDLEGQFDVVISQRMLVNLASWRQQKLALYCLMEAVKPGGLLLLSEGSTNGVGHLNQFRAVMGLEPIPVPAHNVFIDDDDLEGFLRRHRCYCDGHNGLGAYYLLTRGVQPALTKDIRWDSDFNRRSALAEVYADEFSRVKQWRFTR